MKFIEFLGLKDTNGRRFDQTECPHSDPAHLRAMKLVNGDPSHMQAIDVFRGYAKSDARRNGIQDGSIVEIYPEEAPVMEHVKPHRPAPQNVRIIVDSVVEVQTVELFDQDKEIG